MTRTKSIIPWGRRKLRGLALRVLRRLNSDRGDLRQFVYLDEIALRSLMASRYGAEEVRYLESKTTGHDRGTNFGGQVGLSESQSFSAGSTSSKSSSRSLEVERQPTVQSMFSEFLRREREAGLLRWDTTARTGYPKAVQRGDLLQLRVRLAADPVYQVGAFISEFADMAQGLSQDQQIDITQLTQLSGILERLMVGQVPVKAEVIDFGVKVENGDYRIHGGESAPSTPLSLVGSTDLSKYWTDTRRVLYGDQVFTVLVRATVDGPTREWSPIKLFDMMRQVIPGLSETLQQLEGAIGQVQAVASAGDPDFVEVLAEALSKYAGAHGWSTDDVGLSNRIESLAARLAPDLPSASRLDAAFDEVDGWLGSEVASHDGYETIRAARAAAREAASIDVRGHWVGRPIAAAMPPRSAGAFIEAEVIAIYW